MGSGSARGYNYRPRGGGFIRSAAGSLLGGTAGSALKMGAAGAAGYLAFDNIEEIIRFVKTAVQMVANPSEASKIWGEAYGSDEKSESEVRNDVAEKTTKTNEQILSEQLSEPKPEIKPATVAEHDAGTQGSMRTTQHTLGGEQEAVKPLDLDNAASLSAARAASDLKPALVEEAPKTFTYADHNKSIDDFARQAISSDDRSAIFGNFDKDNLSPSEKSFSELPDLKISKMTMHLAGVKDPGKASVDLEIPLGAKTYEQVMAFNAKNNPDLMNPANVVSISSVNDSGYTTHKNFEIMSNEAFRPYRSGVDMEAQGQWVESANFRDASYKENRGKLLASELELDADGKSPNGDVRRIGIGLPGSGDKFGVVSTEMTPSDLMAKVSRGEGGIFNRGDSDIATGLTHGAGLMGQRNGGFFSESEYMKLSANQPGVFAQGESDKTRAEMSIDQHGTRTMSFSLSHDKTEEREMFDQSINITSGKEGTTVAFSSLSGGIRNIAIGQDLPLSELRIDENGLTGDAGNKSGKLMSDLGQKIYNETGAQKAFGEAIGPQGTFISAQTYDKDSNSMKSSEIAVNGAGNRFIMMESGKISFGEINHETGEMRVASRADAGVKLGEDGRFQVDGQSKDFANAFLSSKSNEHILPSQNVVDKSDFFVPGVSGALSEQAKPQAPSIDKGVESGEPSASKGSGVMDRILNVANIHQDIMDKKSREGGSIGRVASAGVERD